MYRNKMMEELRQNQKADVVLCKACCFGIVSLLLASVQCVLKVPDHSRRELAACMDALTYCMKALTATLIACMNALTACLDRWHERVAKPRGRAESLAGRAMQNFGRRIFRNT